MERICRKIVQMRVPILIIGILLLIPAGWGYVNTHVNYDILYYLPDDIETMRGRTSCCGILARGPTPCS